MSVKEKYTLLLIEDNLGDIRLAQEFLINNPYIEELIALTDGIKGLQYLRKQDSFKQASTPDLVILDLNLPKKNGFEVLKEIKTDEHLKYLPVIILTSSASKSDIDKCYECNANCYITKPIDFKSFYNVFNAIITYWCKTAILPKPLNQEC